MDLVLWEEEIIVDGGPLVLLDSELVFDMGEGFNLILRQCWGVTVARQIRGEFVSPQSATSVQRGGGLGEAEGDCIYRGKEFVSL